MRRTASRGSARYFSAGRSIRERSNWSIFSSPPARDKARAAALRPRRAAARALSRAGGLLKIDQFDRSRIDRPAEKYLADPREAVRRIGRQKARRHGRFVCAQQIARL